MDDCCEAVGEEVASEGDEGPPEVTCEEKQPDESYGCGASSDHGAGVKMTQEESIRAYNETTEEVKGSEEAGLPDNAGGVPDEESVPVDVVQQEEISKEPVIADPIQAKRETKLQEAKESMKRTQKESLSTRLAVSRTSMSYKAFQKYGRGEESTSAAHRRHVPDSRLVYKGVMSRQAEYDKSTKSSAEHIEKLQEILELIAKQKEENRRLKEELMQRRLRRGGREIIEVKDRDRESSDRRYLERREQGRYGDRDRWACERDRVSHASRDSTRCNPYTVMCKDRDKHKLKHTSGSASSKEPSTEAWERVESLVAEKPRESAARMEMERERSRCKAGHPRNIWTPQYVAKQVDREIRQGIDDS